MSERDVIDATEHPATAASLGRDLAALGLGRGATVMVHTSLSALGYVVGGAETVVTALRDTIGPHGTLMMPTHSSQYTDPGGWRNPPVPPGWIETMRATMPPFDPEHSPTRGMGVVAEHFRRLPGVGRSTHPTVSAAAVGPRAADLLSDHSLDRGLGEGSPQARLYDLDGQVLLLGVSHVNNTALHLAEHRAVPVGHPLLAQSSPVVVDGVRRWVAHDELDDDNDFGAIGVAFAATGAQRSGPVGAGVGHLMRVRAVVDFAQGWLEREGYAQ